MRIEGESIYFCCCFRAFYIAKLTEAYIFYARFSVSTFTIVGGCGGGVGGGSN